MNGFTYRNNVITYFMKKILSAITITCLCCTAVSCSNAKEEDKNAEAPEVQQNLPVYNIKQSATSTLNKKQKNVLVISASPRRGGNTDLLCDEFVRGAKEAGGNVEKIFLDDYKIDFFHEQHEQSADSVAPDDQAPLIIDKMTKADIIVLSSPVYYMNIDGQLKALMDRCFRNQGLGGKEFYYITACADAEDSTAETAIFAFRGFVVCLPDPVERGMVKAVGMGRKGAVEQSQYMQEAYKLGKTI